MKPAALGLQMHSGWGVLVAVSANPFAMLARRRIVVADPDSPRELQPYHFAAGLPPPQQENHIARCAAESSRLAGIAIAEVMEELSPHRIAGAAVLCASGRPLPALPKILAAHPLIHAAEGELFRQTAMKALEDLQIPVTAVRDRELDQRVIAAFGDEAMRLELHISGLGGLIGPPWTRDHKRAALAAAFVLGPVSSIL